MKSCSQDSRSPGQDSNTGPRLLTETTIDLPRRWVEVHIARERLRSVNITGEATDLFQLWADCRFYNCICNCHFRLYKCVSKSFRSGSLERELQILQLSAIRCSYITILWVSLEGFAAITLCVASQRVFVVASVYFIIDSVRKLLDIAWYGI
jgi:hypothetical protein